MANTADLLQISPSRVARIIVLARDLEDNRPLLETYIADLNSDEQASLVAVAWIGRETFGAEELAEAIATAKQEATTPTEEYLLGMPMLASLLEAGLEELGHDVDALEDEHLK